MALELYAKHSSFNNSSSFFVCVCECCWCSLENALHQQHSKYSRGKLHLNEKSLNYFPFNFPI